MKYLYSLFFILLNIISLKAGESILYVENKGQWHENVKYRASIPNGALFLENGGWTFNILDQAKISRVVHRHGKKNRPEDFPDSIAPKDKNDIILGHAFKANLLNSNANSLNIPSKKTTEYFNYFIGDDNSKWAGGCFGYEIIKQQNVYNNIDLLFYTNDNNNTQEIKYDFICNPNSSVSDIQIAYNGLDKIFLSKEGALILKTVLGNIIEQKPYAYQIIEGKKIEVSCDFVLKENTISFNVGDYQKNNPLIIDPTIIFSSFSGSNADNFGNTASYDDLGNLYGAGTVFSAGYPITIGAYQISPASTGSLTDIGITKFSTNGNSRVYSTYIGGNSADVPHSLIVDRYDNLYLYGTTSSTNYPTTIGAYDRTFNGGTSLNFFSGFGVNYNNGTDIIITKFNALGNALIGSTYIGGTANDGVTSNTALVYNYADQIRGEIELDASDNVYIISSSASVDYPTTTGSNQTVYGGGNFDGIITKLNSNLNQIIWSSFLGGSGDEFIYSLDLNKNNDPVVAGGTTSPNFPIIGKVIDSTYNGNVDGFIAKYNSAGDSLLFSTYYGTPSYDQIYFVELTRTDTIHVYGQTQDNTNFFIKNAAFSNPNSGQFISRFTQSVDTVVWSTVFGRGTGSPDISPTAFLVDFCGKIYTSGWGTFWGVPDNPAFHTGASGGTFGLPVTSNALQSTTDNGDFYLMVLEDDASAINYATFFGGVGGAGEHVDGGTSRFDKNGIIYHAVCAGCHNLDNFPIYPNAASVVSATNNSFGCNLAVFKMDFGLPVSADFSAPSACANNSIPFTNLSLYRDPINANTIWDFGDGQTDTSKNPIHVYATSGIYTIKLKITDPSSCNSVDSISKTIVILNNKSDSLPDKWICPGASIRIGISPVRDTALHYWWKPTIGLSDTTIFDPIATPPSSTQYLLFLNKNLCTDTVKQRVIIKQPDNVQIVGDTFVCAAANAVVTATSISKGTYTWSPAPTIIGTGGNTALLNTPNDVKIYLLFSDSLGCVSRDTATAHVLNNLIDVTGDTLTCKNNSVTLSVDSIPNVTYTWTPASLILSGAGTTHPVVKADTSRYFYLTALDNSGCIIYDSIFIRVIENEFKIKGDTLVCNGQNIQFSVISNPQLSYQWSSDVNGSLGSGNTVNTTINQPTTIYVNIIDNLGCIAKDSLKVKTINNELKITADTLTCKNATVSINATALAVNSYAWNPASKVLSGGNTNSVTMLADASRWYYLTVVKASGCTYTDSIFIQLINDILHITGDSITCKNQNVSLQATTLPNATYSWAPISKILSGANTNSILTLADSTRYYQLVVTDNSGCTLQDSFPVKVINDLFRIQADTFICKNFTTQIQTPLFPNVSYSWSPAANIVSGGNTNAPSVSLASTGKLFVTLTDNSGCTYSDSVNIRIIEDYLTLMADTTNCKNNTITVTATNIPNATYSWKPAADILSINNNIANYIGTTSKYFALLLTDNSGCTVQDSIHVLIMQDLMHIDADTFVCKGDTVKITTTNYVGASYTWNPTPTISGAGTYQVQTVVNGNTTYNVQIIDTNNCIITGTILVKTLEQGFIITADDTTLCRGDSLKLRTPYVTGASYTWYPTKFFVGGSINNPIAVIPRKTGFIATLKDSAKGCTVSDTIIADIDTSNLYLSAPTNICINDSFYIKANYVPNAQYSYTPNPELFIADTLVRYRANDTSIYIGKMITSPFGCVLYDTLKVNAANQLADLVATASPQIIEYGTKSQLLAKAKQAVNFQWTPDPTLSSLIIPNPMAAPLKTTTYYVEVLDNIGCKNTAKVEVIIQYEPCNEKEVYLPNAFSPNGDGKNDVLYVRGNNVESLELLIYDRWGQKMFETKDQKKGWDGTFNGKLLEPAVFAFSLKATCIGGAVFEKKGNITLLR